MPGVAMDGSEDLPPVVDDYGHQITHRPPQEMPRYPAGDYLSQKLANAYGELKILTDNIHAMDEKHLKRLIEINSMVASTMVWLQDDLQERCAC